MIKRRPLKQDKMKNSSSIFQEERFNQLIFHDFHEDSEIESVLLGQKYHQNISLQLPQSNNKLVIIGKGLEQLTHLVGLKISLKECSFEIKESSFRDIFSSLKVLQNLQYLILDIKTPNLIYYRDAIQILANSVSCLTQLERLELIFPTFYEKEFNVIKDSLEPLNCLKELRIDLSNSLVNDCVSDFFAQVNKKQSLISLQFILYTGGTFQPIKGLWELDNLINLQEIQINSDLDLYCEKQIQRLGEQIKSLQSLIRLTLQIKANQASYIDIRKLFNSILSLERLEELNISLSSLPPIDIEIGEQVCQDSKLRIFSFSSNDNYLNWGKRTIVLGKHMINIKHLERLNLHIDKHDISDRSFQLLSEWKKEWNELTEISLYVRNIKYQKETLKILSFLRDCFQTVKSIKIFKTNLKWSNLEEQSDLLYGLGQLENLQTLKCIHLYESSNKNIQQQYVQCFQKLQSLRELKIDTVFDNEEVLCLGLSLQYLNNLTTLIVCFVDITLFKHFSVFCRNLKYLTKLKYLYFEIASDLGLDNEILIIGQQEIQTLQQSISAIQSLNQLDMLITFEKTEDQIMFVNELVKISKANKHLYVLSLQDCHWILTRNKIYRHFKRLVKLVIF